MIIVGPGTIRRCCNNNALFFYTQLVVSEHGQQVRLNHLPCRPSHNETLHVIACWNALQVQEMHQSLVHLMVGPKYDASDELQHQPAHSITSHHRRSSYFMTLPCVKFGTVHTHLLAG
jgi:hypothetical protein